MTAAPVVSTYRPVQHETRQSCVSKSGLLSFLAVGLSLVPQTWTRTGDFAFAASTETVSEVQAIFRCKGGYGMISASICSRSFVRVDRGKRSWASRVKALSFVAPSLLPQQPAPEPHLLPGRGICRPVRPAPFICAISQPSVTSKRSSGQLHNGKERITGCGEGTGSGSNMVTHFSWMDSVNSTMDEVRNMILQGKGGQDIFSFSAKEQLIGRGTRGRSWIGLPGNVFLTVAVPLERVPVPLSVIPLRIGTLIAPEINQRLKAPSPPLPESLGKMGTEPPPVSLKWPNDVLLGGRKVAGVLIEAELPYLLVGIGVNVRHKPEVPTDGPQRGRPAACMAEYGATVSDEAVQELSMALAAALCKWVSGEDSAQMALSDWEEWVDWKLPMEVRDERRPVTPLGVAPDGRLRVQDVATGKEELLTTEYLL
ncbi:unnamed protein product [Choristocarpus tenellus]